MIIIYSDIISIIVANLEQEKAQVTDQLRRVQADFTQSCIELEKQRRDSNLRQEQDKMAIENVSTELKQIHKQFDETM